VAKVQAQAGKSLADVYAVEGSIVGVEELVTQDVTLSHEMGGEIHSERLTCNLVRISSGDIAASTTFDVGVNPSGTGVAPFYTPDVTNRILGVFVAVVAADVNHFEYVAISLRDLNSSQEMPIYTWDDSDDDQTLVRWNDGGSAAEYYQLRAKPTFNQTLATRMGDEQVMCQIQFRGKTKSGFGGTGEAIALVQCLRPARVQITAGQPRSHGLPLPSW